MEAVEDELGLARGTLDPRLMRRNIVVRGIDLNALRHSGFSLDSGDGPVSFEAAGETSPCAWMDDRLATGRAGRAARAGRPASQPDDVRHAAASGRSCSSRTSSRTPRWPAPGCAARALP